MKKLILIAIVVLSGTLSFYSCKAGHEGGCDAFGSSHSMLVVKEVGKSL